MQQFASASLQHVVHGTASNAGAAFTAQSKVTGKDYTFKIVSQAFKGCTYKKVYVEQGYMNFVYLGYYLNGLIYLKREPVETDAAKAIAWILRRVDAKEFSILDRDLTLLHLGRCVRCGRVLTDSESIKTGLGPVCRSL